MAPRQELTVQDLMDKLEKYQDLVEETVDLDLSSHGSILKADLDEDLLSLRNQLNSVVNQLDSEHKRVGNDLGLDIEKKLHLENHQTYKYCLRVTKAVSFGPSQEVISAHAA
jgi:DNA mismatch repair protein MSH2